MNILGEYLVIQKDEVEFDRSRALIRFKDLEPITYFRFHVDFDHSMPEISKTKVIVACLEHYKKVYSNWWINADILHEEINRFYTQ